MSSQKYHNKPTIVDGIRFASKREANRYGELCLLEKAGKIKTLLLQIPFPLRINGELVCTYVADFTYHDCEDGAYVVEDAKGVRTGVYQLKAKLMKALRGIVIREV